MLKEGLERKGGINSPPTTPKPKQGSLGQGCKCQKCKGDRNE